MDQSSDFTRQAKKPIRELTYELVNTGGQCSQCRHNGWYEVTGWICCAGCRMVEYPCALDSLDLVGHKPCACPRHNCGYNTSDRRGPREQQACKACCTQRKEHNKMVTYPMSPTFLVLKSSLQAHAMNIPFLICPSPKGIARIMMEASCYENYHPLGCGLNT